MASESENPSIHRPRRLILCFDGTAEKFEGSSADTNVVKLYSMFDRTARDQLHYYQPGVGTYPANGESTTPTLFSRIRNKMAQALAQAFGLSFNTHVMDGYRFLLRYYEEGDEIYIFGFSRGAFTARFLARFVSQMGILSRGNEQLVPFAYSNFLDYERGHGREDMEQYLQQFTKTFCRHYNQNDTETGRVRGVQIHFLGLFDTVNSIALLETGKGASKPPKVYGTAKHVRHAVAADEARVKFKPALLSQDQSIAGLAAEDIKEVWFPGAHSDIGGGNKAQEHLPREKDVAADIDETTQLVATSKAQALQLSDIPLKWMIDELDTLPGSAIQWSAQKDGFLHNYRENIDQATAAIIHNTLIPGQDAPLSTLLWQFFEILPLRHWQYSDGRWRISRAPNLGRCRDIPPNAVFHQALVERLHHDSHYHPANAVWLSTSEIPVELDTVGTNVAENVSPIDSLFTRTSPLRTRFRLFSMDDEAVNHVAKDYTYCVEEVFADDHIRRGYAAEETSTT